MTIGADDQTAVSLRRALADELAERGALRSPAWRAAFEQVPGTPTSPLFFVWADNHHFVAVDPTAPDALE
ncbi:MAG: hypothetical protein GEU83_19030 [Pseudonocardiaceae bacterium]|nr:hypothetical protein [Pseudonocardiaceae bacterium]